VLGHPVCPDDVVPRRAGDVVERQLARADGSRSRLKVTKAGDTPRDLEAGFQELLMSRATAIGRGKGQPIVNRHLEISRPPRPPTLKPGPAAAVLRDAPLRVVRSGRLPEYAIRRPPDTE